MTLLLAHSATATLLAFLQAQLPIQIEAVNADTPAETPLTDFATYIDHQVAHLPPVPVLAVLPAVLTLANESPGFMETATDFSVVIVVGDGDESADASAVRRYVAAVARCVASTRNGTPIPNTNGASLYWGSPAAVFSATRPDEAGSGWYLSCQLNLSLLIGETT